MRNMDDDRGDWEHEVKRDKALDENVRTVELKTRFVDSGTVADDNMSNDELLAAYEKLLRKHDWYFNFSDDHRYWVAGEASSKCIGEVEALMAARGMGATYIALWNTICPWAKNGENPRKVVGA